MPNVTGIDPSLSGTAVCVLDETGKLVSMERFTSKPAEGLYGRIERYTRLVADVIDAVQRADPIASLCIEGYSFGSNDASAKFAAEYGGLLRNELTIWPCIEEVSPSGLKKFVSGKGNGDKTATIGAIASQYGVTFKTNDEYDAYGLARVALALAGFVEPKNDAQRQVLAVLRGEVTKKPKRKAKA